MLLRESRGGGEPPLLTPSARSGRPQRCTDLPEGSGGGGGSRTVELARSRPSTLLFFWGGGMGGKREPVFHPQRCPLFRAKPAHTAAGAEPLPSPAVCVPTGPRSAPSPRPRTFPARCGPAAALSVPSLCLVGGCLNADSPGSASPARPRSGSGATTLRSGKPLLSPRCAPHGPFAGLALPADHTSPTLRTASTHPRSKEGPPLQGPPLPGPRWSLRPQSGPAPTVLGVHKSASGGEREPPRRANPAGRR